MKLHEFRFAIKGGRSWSERWDSALYLKKILLVALLPIGLAGCKRGENDSKPKFVLVSRDCTFANFGCKYRTVIGFAPVIYENGSIPGRCWYSSHLESPPEAYATEQQFFDEVTAQAELVTPKGYIPTAAMTNRLLKNIALNTASLALEAVTFKASCSGTVAAAVSGVGVPAAAIGLGFCALSIYGIVTSNSQISESSESMVRMKIGESKPVRFSQADADVSDLILATAVDAYKNQEFMAAICPSASTLGKYMLKQIEAMRAKKNNTDPEKLP